MRHKKENTAQGRGNRTKKPNLENVTIKRNRGKPKGGSLSV